MSPVLARLLCVLSLATVLAPAAGRAQSTLAVVDDEPIDPEAGEPGPGDNMVFSVRRNATYVVSLAFTTGAPGEIVTHRLQPDGKLDFVGRTPAGREPRQIALARKGDYAVVVNSIDDEIASMRVGADGRLTEVDRKPSGGDNPYDVAALGKNRVVVVNRDSDNLTMYTIDRTTGLLTLVGSVTTGDAPHVVSVSRRGHVAVCNQEERSISLFELNRRGELVPLGAAIPMSIPGSTERMTPRTASWHRDYLYVALDSPNLGDEDVIRAFRVTRRGVIQGADTPAGAFLTDLEANEDGLFAVTVNTNGADPDRNEIRVYRSKKGVLTPDAAVQTDGPPSFKQLATFPGKKAVDRHVLVTEFQNGWLRSLVYDYRRR